MTRSGFVLVGGASRRMGRDKALLPLGGSTMVEQIAARVRAAAGNVTLIGSPEKYGHLGFNVVPDEVENCGPLGGLYTALRLTQADWNVLVACAEASDADCAVPEINGKIDPLCAVYHARLAMAAESAIHRKSLKMQDFVSGLRTVIWRVTDPGPLENVNTPAEWSTR